MKIKYCLVQITSLKVQGKAQNHPSPQRWTLRLHISVSYCFFCFNTIRKTYCPISRSGMRKEISTLLMIVSDSEGQSVQFLYPVSVSPSYKKGVRSMLSSSTNKQHSTRAHLWVITSCQAQICVWLLTRFWRLI